jgi:hypothetical protein
MMPTAQPNQTADVAGAARGLLAAWRARDPLRLDVELKRAAGSRLPCPPEDDERGELLAGLVSEMRRTADRWRREPGFEPEEGPVVDRLLAHLARAW